MGSKEIFFWFIYEYNNFCIGLLINFGQDYFVFEKYQFGMFKDLMVVDIEKEFFEDWLIFFYIVLDDMFVLQYDGKNYFSMLVVLMVMFSWGLVMINSIDMVQNLIVDFCWLDDLRDKEMVVVVFCWCRVIVVLEMM